MHEMCRYQHEDYPRAKIVVACISKDSIDHAMCPIIEMYISRSTDLPFTIREYGGKSQVGPHVVQINKLWVAGLIAPCSEQAHSYSLTDNGRKKIAEALGGSN